MQMNRRRFLAAGSAGLALAGSSRFAAAQAPTKMRIGVVPLLSSGPLFIAVAKGYFTKVGLDVELRTFADGALAIPALVAGELDATVATINAGMINAVNKGAPYKLMLDRGGEKPGLGSMTIVVSNKMYEAGVTGVDKFALLKGKRMSLQAPGAIDQYLLGRGLQKAGLDPRTDAIWSSGLTYPDIVKSLGSDVTDAAQIPVPLAFLAEANNVGKIIGTGADIEPNAQLACWAMPIKFLEGNRPAAVRFAMAHIQAARVFTEAAKTKNPEIIEIISAATKVPPALIAKAAPRWTGYDPDGMPNVESCFAQAAFWIDTMKLISGPAPTREKLFELSVAQEAARMLASNNPFGNG